MATTDQDRRNKKARILSESERLRLDEFIEAIQYSPRSVHIFYILVLVASDLLRIL